MSQEGLPPDGVFLNLVEHGELPTLSSYIAEHEITEKQLGNALFITVRNLQASKSCSNTVKCLELLLEHKAKWVNTFVLDKHMTPCHVIAQLTEDRGDLLRYFIDNEKTDLCDIRDNRGCTALMYAVLSINISCARVLISKGADVNTTIKKRFSDMLTPLIVVIKQMNCSKGDEDCYNACNEMFDLLIQSGADFNKQCSSNKTPAMYAALQGNLAVLAKLTQCKAKLKLLDSEGKSIGAHGASSGNVDVLKYLHEHGFDMHATDKQGKGVLHYAVQSRSVEAVRYLLDIGVAVKNNHVPNQRKKKRLFLETDVFPFQRAVDPSMLAIDMNVLGIIKIMEEYDAQTFQTFNAIRKAVKCSSVESLEYLLSKYTYELDRRYSTQYSYGNSPFQTILTEACHIPVYQVPKLLLEHNANPNKKNSEKQGCTPLHVAIVQDPPKVETIALLIRSGANVDVSSYDSAYGIVLPFEAAVLHQRASAAKMLQAAACSSGVYSLNEPHRFSDHQINPIIQDLMDELEIEANNPRSMQSLCRKAILQYLSPAAETKVHCLPLPKNIRTYLLIPELDDIIKDENLAYDSQWDTDISDITSESESSWLSSDSSN